jgi:hypothetical protein
MRSNGSTFLLSKAWGYRTEVLDVDRLLVQYDSHELLIESTGIQNGSSEDTMHEISRQCWKSVGMEWNGAAVPWHASKPPLNGYLRCVKRPLFPMLEALINPDWLETFLRFSLYIKTQAVPWHASKPPLNGWGVLNGYFPMLERESPILMDLRHIGPLYIRAHF